MDEAESFGGDAQLGSFLFAPHSPLHFPTPSFSALELPAVGGALLFFPLELKLAQLPLQLVPLKQGEIISMVLNATTAAHLDILLN